MFAVRHLRADGDDRAITQLDPDDHDPDGPREHLLRWAGRSYPWVELRIADPATVVARHPHEVGEVSPRAPNVNLGNFNRPAETAAALFTSGWLRTRDGGYVNEEGYLFLTDRIKDMIVSGGENVYPIEVEEALSQHPDVVDVAVIGLPDERWGETVKACRQAPSERRHRRAARGVRASTARLLQAPALDRAHAGASAHTDGKVLRRKLRERHATVTAGHTTD